MKRMTRLEMLQFLRVRAQELWTEAQVAHQARDFRRARTLRQKAKSVEDHIKVVETSPILKELFSEREEERTDA